VFLSQPLGEPQGEPTMRWEPGQGQEFSGRLWIENGRCRLFSEREGWFDVDRLSPSIGVPAEANPYLRERRLWGIPAVLCFLARGDLSVHAAAVQIGNQAVLLAGPGRFGKTTLAAGFLRAGYRVLTEDISCCRPGGTPLLFPGPAVLRVRGDIYKHLDLPGTKAIVEEVDRVHLVLDEVARGDGAPIPISGIVFLRRGPEGRARMERVEPTRALPDLWALSWRLPSTEDVIRCFDGITSLIDSIRIWNLYREPSLDGLDEVVSLIATTTAR
jgi:hypothetical protein